MGMVYRIYLDGERIYGCKTCKTHLATIDSMISRVSPPITTSSLERILIKLGTRHLTGSMAERTYLMECKLIQLSWELY